MQRALDGVSQPTAMPGLADPLHALTSRRATPGSARASAARRPALRMRRRRRDWRLGRFTAKAAVGAWLSVAPERVEILAAPDGAPEAWVDGERAPVSVSLSHRAGRALAVVAHAPAVVGCDLELRRAAQRSVRARVARAGRARPARGTRAGATAHA